MTVRRVVVDTNVLISGVLRPKGPPQAVVDILVAGVVVPLFSDTTFEELRTRILRRKFDRYVGRTGREHYVERLADVAEWVAISGARMGCRDPDDDKFLETALAGGADCLITGDRDLLEMSPFTGIPILAPAAFLEMQRESGRRD